MCVLKSACGEVVQKGECGQACRPPQVTEVCVCVFISKHTHGGPAVTPQGQKSWRMREYYNITARSPEHCVNMGTMEMHCAIMAGFMHFSPAERTGRIGRDRGGEDSG